MQAPEGTKGETNPGCDPNGVKSTTALECNTAWTPAPLSKAIGLTRHRAIRHRSSLRIVDGATVRLVGRGR